MQAYRFMPLFLGLPDGENHDRHIPFVVQPECANYLIALKACHRIRVIAMRAGYQHQLHGK
ncbi:hypothetical protein D3C84_1250030 [compost metagenome]